MSMRWLIGLVAATALFAVAACNDSAVSGTPSGAASQGSSEAADDPASDGATSDEGSTAPDADSPTSDAPDAGDNDDAGDAGDSGGDSSLPADPMAEDGPFDVDACAVLIRAVGAEAIEAAMGDPVVDSSSLFGSCSMYTADYTINEAGSTSTGRLSFGISPTSLAGIASADATPVDGLADSALDAVSILWHRDPYWFTLQILPVQKQETDPDSLAPEALVNLARLIDANA